MRIILYIWSTSGVICVIFFIMLQLQNYGCEIIDFMEISKEKRMAREEKIWPVAEDVVTNPMMWLKFLVQNEECLVWLRLYCCCSTVYVYEQLIPRSPPPLGIQICCPNVVAERCGHQTASELKAFTWPTKSIYLVRC